MFKFLPKKKLETLIILTEPNLYVQFEAVCSSPANVPIYVKQLNMAHFLLLLV